MPPELFDYQREGAKWLSERTVALLADKQRLGKSCQAITAAEIIKATKICIVCKAVARSNWENEWKKFAQGDWSYRILYGEAFGKVTVRENQVVILSYDAAGFLLAGLDGSFDVLILDESHSLKSLDTKRTQLILGKEGLCRRAKRIWALTGTPAPNHAAELWTLLFTFRATTLSYASFVEKFCVTRDSGYGLQITGTKTDKSSLQGLREIIKKVTLRREESDVSIQMPKMFFSSVVLDPGLVDAKFLRGTSLCRYSFNDSQMEDFNKIIAEQLGIFKALVRKAGGVKSSDALLEVLKAEAKSISTLRRYTGLQKLEPAIEIIKGELEAKAYRKCVIFAIHKDMIQGCQARLADFHPVTLYGASNPNTVEKNLRKFQSPNSQCQVFIGNILAAGTSISLSAANHIFFLERDWVPGNNAQAAMRCGGPNQKNPIFVRDFILKDSYDFRVEQLLTKKTNEIAKIFADENQTLEDFL